MLNTAITNIHFLPNVIVHTTLWCGRT